MSIRAERVGAEIKKLLANPIESLGNENEVGLTTVTSVRVSDDLSSAKVYISLYGEDISPGKFISILEREKGALRGMITSQMRLRKAPDLKFYLDDTLEKMEEIQSLIDTVKKDSKDVDVNLDDYDPKELEKKKKKDK